MSWKWSESISNTKIENSFSQDKPIILQKNEELLDKNDLMSEMEAKEKANEIMFSKIFIFLVFLISIRNGSLLFMNEIYK